MCLAQSLWEFSLDAISLRYRGHIVTGGGSAGVGLNALDVAVDNFYAGALTTPRARKYSILSFQ